MIIHSFYFRKCVNMGNKAINFLKEKGYQNDIIEVNSACSAKEAAQELKVDLDCIAKSLTFRTNNKAVMVVMSGNTKIDSNKFRKHFKIKSKMLEHEEVYRLTGYEIGGVCPFDIDENKMDILFDVSLKENEIVYPGAGSKNHLLKIKLSDLERLCNYPNYIDIGKKNEY